MADLISAYLNGAYLNGAHLEGAYLYDTYLIGAPGWTAWTFVAPT
jgi:uncharacterized protein YjbI with pentapeptide repeats